MTPRDLKNIHTIRNSCRDTRPCVAWHQHYSSIFTCRRRRLLVATSKFSLLNIRWHSVTRKHLFLYAQGERSGLRKQKRISKINHSYHQRSLPKPVSTDLTIKSDLVLINPAQPTTPHPIFSYKRWDARLVDVIKKSTP